MKPVHELILGYKDAENYRRRENKLFFNHLFLKNKSLDRLCSPSSFFLVGEKGTGKTAHAVFMANNFYQNNHASLRYIRETEYQKFLQLKQSKNLDLSDYTNIWKVILCLLIAQQIREKESDFVTTTLGTFAELEAAIDDYYSHAFTPEILHAIQFAEEATVTAEIIFKHLKTGGKTKVSQSFTENRFQTNLLYIQRKFEDALSSLRLKSGHLLFIDGIDIRPTNIPYADYLECVKGLANAVWSLNNDFFASLKTKGRIRCILLIRPDIFNSLGLQNQNSKFSDNSVILNWITSYPEYRHSDIFQMADKLLGSQQEEQLGLGQAWDHYFPFDARNVESRQTEKSAFITFLRYSLHRPRNVLTMLSILKENFIEEGHPKTAVFSGDDIDKPAFTRKYSDYLLGEVKDQIAFYHSVSDYEMFVKFFQFLHGHSAFSYAEFLSAFKEFENFLQVNNFPRPAFCSTPDAFLQFLYELDVVGYLSRTENRQMFYGWCHKDRSTSNIAPKVRTGVQYEMHFGLMKALDLGRRLRRNI